MDHLTGKNRPRPAGGVAQLLTLSSSSVVPECVGQRFSWLHAVFHDLPSLLNFAAKLRCSSGLCPRDLDDYGCTCTHLVGGAPVDPLDR